MDYQLFKTAAGLRVAWKPVKGARVAYCGFVIKAGSRNDNVDGAAHALEHMLFKGTNTRSNYRVLNFLESVGGELNAFTTKEYTAIYATVLNTHFNKAVDLLCDVTFHSVFPEAELKKELKVIQEEIRMYEDTPEENIYDEFQEKLFFNSPLAHNILGDIDSVEQITRRTLIDFQEDNYTTNNLVFVVVGNIGKERILKTLERFLPSQLNVHSRKNNLVKTQVGTEKFDLNQKTEFAQGHLMLGVQAYAELHALRWPLLLVNNYFGGPGMNSILNLEIREKHGLAYQVESGYQAFSDAGMFHAYIGCEKSNLQRSEQLILDCMQKLRKNGMTGRQIAAAKKQFAGQIAIADENKSGVMVHIGKGILRDGQAKSLDEILKLIDAIKSEEVHQVLEDIFDSTKYSVLRYN